MKKITDQKVNLSIGAGEGVRTLDFHLGNPFHITLMVLNRTYQLLDFSYLFHLGHKPNYTQIDRLWGNSGATTLTLTLLLIKSMKGVPCQTTKN
jgi:hypothetical protein